MEKWFNYTIKELNSPKVKLDTILIEDNRVYSLKGVCISSVGDSSKDFSLSYNQQTVLGFLEPSQILSLLPGLGVVGEIKLN